MLLQNMYEKILLHLGPLIGFVLAVHADCILKGCMLIQTTNKIGLLSKVTQTGTIILELLISKRIVKLRHCIERSCQAVRCGS